ncbi:hypothetical protein DXU07_23920 [Bradyrhizobium elkanii]|nr:hypothetical protein A6X20_17745 [Bradyrhizobium elkanii]ODM85386.1 hypothetical protein A6452_12315 [Bradyrhizobium elkanii]
MMSWAELATATMLRSLSRLRGRAGVGALAASRIAERAPTRRAQARKSAAERVGLPRKRERRSGSAARLLQPKIIIL